MSQLPDELADRRLIERLSGWRLYVFFTVAVVNLVFLIGLSGIVLDVSPSIRGLLIAILAALVSLFALTVGAFRFPDAVKISLVAFFVVWSLWAAGRINSPGPSRPELAETFFVFLIQSLMLTIGSTIFWHWTAGRERSSFAARDLLVLLTAAAILFPALQYVIRDWSGLWQMTAIGFSGWVGLALINAAWCIVVVCLYVPAIVPFGVGGPAVNSRGSSRLWQLGTNRFVLLAAVSGLLAGLECLLNSDFVWQRIIYLAWMVVSMVPVVGLTAVCDTSGEIKPKMPERQQHRLP